MEFWDNVAYGMMARMQREYTAVYKKSGRWTVAWIDEIPGVNTQGRTLKEARENLRDALSMMLEEQRREFHQGKTVRREKIRVLIPAGQPA